MQFKTTFGALMLGASLLASTAALAATESTQREPGRLTVSSSTHIEATPDIAIISGKLTEYTPFVLNQDAHKPSRASADKARQRLEDRMGYLIRDLESAGIPSRNIQAGTLSASRSHQYRPAKDGDGNERWFRTRIDRPISIELHNLERVTEAMDMLSKAGIDTIHGVSYDINNRERYEEAVLAKAVRKAKAEAQIMAAGLDSQLVRVLNVQKGAIHRPAPMAMMRSKAMMDSAESQPAEYRAGELDISANVTVTWEIENAE